MEDLLEQANEIQETLGRSYGLPDDVDEEDLAAGMEGSDIVGVVQAQVLNTLLLLFPTELDALGDEFLEEDEEVPSYLQEDAPEMPSASIQDPNFAVSVSRGS
jgi:charged multivesicular body protein 5